MQRCFGSSPGRNPFDRELSDLVGELSTRSEDFRGLGASHNVRLHTKSEKRFNHPLVGELELSYNRIEVAADAGLMIVTYTAEPGSHYDAAPARQLGCHTRRGGRECRSQGTATQAGPSDWFTGSVYIDALAAPSGRSRLSASSVHFAPGARTACHTHPNGQTIYVLEGVGLCQRRGGPIELIRPGDRVFFEPGEEHWHGAAATRFMTHLAMLEVDDEGNLATWGEHVSDEEYAAAPA